MANRLQADEIRFIVNMDAKNIDAELYKLSSSTDKLNKETEHLKKLLKESEDSYAKAEAKIQSYTNAQMLGTKAHQNQLDILQKNKSKIEEYSQQIRQNTEQVGQNKAKVDQLVQTLKIEDMSMNQLIKRAEELKIQLNSTSQATNPEAYNALEKELTTVRTRMGELRTGAKETENVFTQSDNIFAQFTTGVNKYWATIVAGFKAVEGAFSTFKDLMLSNIGTGREFNAMMSGFNDVLDYAKTALANMDFTDFIQGLRDAYDAGHEASRIIAELFERNNSFELTSLPIKAEMEELKTQLRDVNLSNEERIRIADELIEKNKKLADQQKEIIKQEIDGYEKKMDGQSKLTKEEKEYVIFNYNANIESIRNANKIIELENKKAQFKNGNTALQIKMNAEITKSINDEINQLKQVTTISEETGKAMLVYSEQAYNAMKKYNMLGEEGIQAYVNAQKKWLNVDIVTSREDRRTETMRNRLLKSSDTKATSGGSATDKELQKQKKELNELNKKLETKYLEDQATIKRQYKNDDIKSEAEYNRKIFANEQAYYMVREEALKSFITDKTKEEVKEDVNKQIAQIQDKQLSQEIKFRAELEKIILDANPIEKEKQAYRNRLDALNLIDTESGEIKKTHTEEQHRALELLEKQHKDNLEKINRDAESRKKTQSEKEFEDSFKKEKEIREAQLVAEERALSLKTGTGQLSGTDAFNAEVELHNKRLQLIKDEIDARELAGLKTDKLNDKLYKAEQKLTDKYVAEYNRRINDAKKYGQDIGSVTGSVMTGQQDAMEAFGNIMIDLVFDMLSKLIDAEITRLSAVAVSTIAETTAKEIASKGVFGLGTAAMLTGVITAAMTVAKTALKGLLGKKKSSTTTTSDSGSSSTSSGSIKVKQRAEGKYDVIGTDDGRVYRNVPYSGVAKTGVVSRPTLMGERGSELVVSHPDFMALQKHINYPVIVQAIQDARFGRVPQRAEGKYDSVDRIPVSSDTRSDTNNVLYMLVDALNQFTNKDMTPIFPVSQLQGELIKYNKEQTRFSQK